MSNELPANEFPIVPPTDEKTTEWIVALAAAGLDYRLDHTETGWIIYVPAPLAAAAQAEIDAYETTNHNWPPVPRPEPPAESFDPVSWSPLWVAGLLGVFYVWLGPYTAQSPILKLAAMDPEGVHAGQWWRLVTPLLVHADAGHLLGNIFCLLLLGHAACRRFGSGVAWSLILASAIAGNALEAGLYPHGDPAVGASTAGFGALGILAAHRAVELARRWHFARPAGRAVLLPLGAGIALLAILGTGPQADFAAHAFGMAWGAVLGAALAGVGTPQPPAWCQRALELASIAVVMSAWHAVLQGSRSF